MFQSNFATYQVEIYMCSSIMVTNILEILSYFFVHEYSLTDKVRDKVYLGESIFFFLVSIINLRKLKIIFHCVPE